MNSRPTTIILIITHIKLIGFGAEYGLLVSWSGFKSSVINETAKQFFEIRLWTHKEIIEEFLRYYDQMDDETKELIPLKKIWVVNNSEE